MGVVYDAATRTARMNEVVTAIDSGVGAGTMEIGDAGFATVLAIITLADPCGSVTGDVLTFTFPQSDTSADASGTAAEARIKDSGGTIRVSGMTVGTSGSGANVILDSTSITATQTVTIESGTITHNTSGS